MGMIIYVILSYCFCWIWLWYWLVFELCVCEGFQLLCFRYLWTPMYARDLWTTCEMDVTCGLLCWSMYDLGCMQVGLKSFVVSVDYRVYMGSSMTVWSLWWLLSYLCSYKLVGSVTAGIRARFNIKHVICVFKTKAFVGKNQFWQLITTYIGVQIWNFI